MMQPHTHTHRQKKARNTGGSHTHKEIKKTLGSHIHKTRERTKAATHRNKTEKHKAVAHRTQEKQGGNLSVCQPAIPYELRVTNTQSKQIEKPLRNPTNPKHNHKTIGIPLRNPKKQKKPKL